jgi:hypothetical protein
MLPTLAPVSHRASKAHGGVQSAKQPIEQTAQFHAQVRVDYRKGGFSIERHCRQFA